MATTDQIRDALRSVIDPELRKDIVSLGMVRSIDIHDENRVDVVVSLTTAGCPIRNHFQTAVAEKVTPRTAFRVAEVRAPSELLWHKPDSTWAWTLSRTEAGGTRLVTRIRALHDRRNRAAWLSSLLLLEVGRGLLLVGLAG